ncbi:hypothetical protein RAA17_18730 [Komagataeibacter rhaeticus]|nr:hypothetical protein [Komagataeibacter rhaeticus]
MIPANECERKGDAWMAKALNPDKTAQERQKAAKAAMFAYEDARKLFPAGSADSERTRKKATGHMTWPTGRLMNGSWIDELGLALKNQYDCQPP